MHTNAGTITLLLTQQWALQVLDPQTHEWKYVEPKRGFAFVTVGDSLRFLSDKRLRSAVHRVFPQEETLSEDRFSICYFLRPNNDARFLDQDGKTTVSAQEWYVQKFKTFKQTHEEQAKEPFLTGGMQFAGEMAVWYRGQFVTLDPSQSWNSVSLHQKDHVVNDIYTRRKLITVEI